MLVNKRIELVGYIWVVHIEVVNLVYIICTFSFANSKSQLWYSCIPDKVCITEWAPVSPKLTQIGYLSQSGYQSLPSLHR